MLELAGYQEKKQLYAGSRTIVYRAIRAKNSQPIIIKVLRNPHPSFNELVQFRNQYVITHNLKHPRIVRPIALERYSNGYALVMSDSGAIALGDYWQQSEQSLAEFLDIAIQLAEALHYLSGQRIIHKDIKPANILINPESGKIQLIDFSISSLLPREQQQLTNPNILEGTLAYISPEQTGRMNRGIDYRTDFYGLGVTFFELLTGKLPFESSDPMELVHSHIAKMPPALGRAPGSEGEWRMGNGREIPQLIESIVMKLMAKNAEERYQSALGLKYDLEQCRQEWEATGKITTVELGTRDRCDRFLIPEKLYGREMEVERLLAAFVRVASPQENRVANPLQGKRGLGRLCRAEMMLVAGFSGIGKTAVINEIHKPIVRQRGYFIKGKFDQMGRNIPFSAFVQALRELMGQLLGSSDSEMQAWKEKILTAVRESGQVLIEVIPELERIIGKQPPAPELSGSAAQNRFNLLFQRFIAVFTTPKHPLVMFLDDLQWADSASLNLIKVLMGSGETKYLLLLGAYRDNEVYTAHPLMLTLKELEKERAVISTIVLEPLAIHHINHLVAATLSCSLEVADPLTELVYQKTKGNPFFTTQFLKGLHQDGLIVFNLKLGYWECDLSRVRDAALTDDVVQFMAGRLALLPEATQKVLKLAACIGNQFELETLATICEESSEEVAADIWNALQEGLILPISEAYKFFQGDLEEGLARGATVGYRFLHDRVQQAAYSLIGKKLKPKTHLKIGRLLLSNSSDSGIEENIFDVTNQLNMGRFLIGDLREKDELASLNLMAGRKAKSSTAYLAANDYLNLGIQLLEDGWHRQYDLMLSLYLEAIESEYISTQFENSKALAEIALKEANRILDRLKIHELQIQYYIANNQRKQAVDLGIYALKLLNIELDGISPEVANIEALADLPEMTDLSQIAALRILIATVSAAVIAAPELLVSIAFKMVTICIRYGNSKLAPYAYGFYAWMLCSFLEKIEIGYRFGKLAIKLLEKFNSKEIKCKVYQQFNVFVRHRKEPLENMKALVEAVQSGIEVGDIEYACYAAQDYCILQFFLGQNLSNTLEQQKKYLELIRHNKQNFSLTFTSPWLQLVSNLLGQSVDMSSLAGEFFDEEVTIPILQKQKDKISLFPIFFIKTYLSYLLGDYQIAVQNAIDAEIFQAGSSGFIYYPAYLFYNSLALLAVASRSRSEEEKQNFIDRANCNQQQLAVWTNDAPFNYQHKYDLVKAEYYRVLGKKLEAIELYDRAIALAKENGFIQEEAIANERAALFYLDWGKEKIAATYMQEAYYCYARWGAKAKTDDLEKRYPNLLQSILQQTVQTPNSLDTLTRLTPKIAVVSSTGSAEFPNANLNKSLDLAAVIKAYQVIASTIHIDDLIYQITKVILQHSGGDRCALILPNSDGVWQVEAIGTPEKIEIYSEPIEGETKLPVKLIQYVKNTQKVVAIDDLDTDLPILDEFLNQQQPKSLLCFPILNQGRSIGILYLSNQSTRGIFSYDRIIVLNFICTQAAISLENARLYQTLEEYSQTLEAKVEERTTALRENEKRLRLAMSAAKQGFFDVNLQTDEAVVSQEYVLMLGYDPANFHETAATWRARLHPDDRERTSRAYRAYAAGQTPHYTAEFRQRTKQGDWKWILSMGQFIEWDADGRPTRFLGTHTDISDRKFAEIQLQAQNELLAKIAKGEPLSDIFNTLIYIVEHNLDGVICSILLLDKDNRLRQGAAPSLPSDYNQAVNGILIGEGVGSCGTAAFRNEVVIVSDIATDSLWCPYKDLALTYGLRACWSSPIAASDGSVLGTFAMYYPEVRSPQETELTVIVQMAHIAGIAIERQQAEERLRRNEATLLEAQRVARIGNWEFDIPSQTIAWSPEMFRIYGLKPSQPAPSYPEYLQMLPAEARLRLQKYVERAIAEGTPYTIEYSRVRSDGSLGHHESRAEVERDDRGQVIRLFGTTLDITDRKQAEIALQNLITGTAATTGEHFFPALASHIAKALNVSYAIVSERADEQLHTLGFWANGALQANFAYALVKTPCELTLQLGKFYCERSIQQQFPDDLDLVDMGAESYLGIALRDTQGRSIGNLCILNQQGIPDPHKAEQILRVFAARAAAELERQRAEVAIKRQLAAIEATIDGIAILKEDTYLYVNQAHLDLFGYERAEDLVGKNWRLLYPPEELRRFEREILPVLERDGAWQGEAIAIRKDGSTFAQGVSLTLVEDGLLICVCRDISDLKKARELIVHNALHDPLTDLPNRTLLLERLELAIERSKQIDSYRYGVLFMDLDRFKVINDSLGHVVGDQLLIAIAQKLKKYLRKMDLVARLGGDEFVILLEDIGSTEDLVQIAERILAGCQTPIDIKGHQIFTSISIGIVLGTKDYHQATDLIRDADIAMYRAKMQESNSYKFFDARMHVEALKRLTLETDLRKAIDREEFTIHYQPIVNLLDCRLVGFEALVRWQHPTRGLVSPGEFIPVAEETGLIALLDSWVFHKACEQIVSWNNKFADCYPLKISINLSVPDLSKPTLIRDIDNVLANTGIKGNFINLEITESMLIEDIDITIDLLAQLASRQIQIGIDDFGTGYSSLNYLHRLPVHNLKIDRSFVSQMQAGNRNDRVVSTIIALSKQLGLTVVAEGIETEKQLQQLQQLGCQLGQGYLFSKPLAPSDIESRFLGSNTIMLSERH